MLKTFDTLISTSLVVHRHILTFSWLLKLGNFVSAFFISASGSYMYIAMALCACVAMLQTQLSSLKQMTKQSYLSKSSAI